MLTMNEYINGDYSAPKQRRVQEITYTFV